MGHVFSLIFVIFLHTSADILWNEIFDSFRLWRFAIVERQLLRNIKITKKPTVWIYLQTLNNWSTSFTFYIPTLIVPKNKIISNRIPSLFLEIKRVVQIKGVLTIIWGSFLMSVWKKI